MSSFSNFIVQSDLQSSEVIESDRSSILSTEAEVQGKTKETIDASSVDEEVGDNSSESENDFSAIDNGCKPPKDLQMPLRQYSREVLLELKESPSSNIFPSCLEKSPKSILASHLTGGKDQNNDKKSNESTTEDSANDVKRKQFKKKNAMEKEEPGVGKKHLNVQDRLKKDEIVLSPQRRSFNTGCAVSSSIFNILPNRTITTTRHRLDSLSSSKDLRDSDLNNEHRKQRLDSLGQNQPRDFSQLSRDSNNRRLNRGRLMSRDSGWDSVGRDPDSSSNYGFDKRVMNNSGGGNDRRLNNDEERNRYGYFDRKKNYNDDHVRIEKEPEWFSAGPTSQYDVIELQGFEDYRKEMQSKKNKKSEAKKTESAAKDKTKETTSSDTSKSESHKQRKTEETIREKKDSAESQSVKESESQLEPQTGTLIEIESAENNSKNIINSTVSPSLPDDINAFLNFSELLVDDDDMEITKSRTSKFSLWCQQPESTSNNVVNWMSEKEPVPSTASKAFGEVFSENNVNDVKHIENKSQGDNSNWPSFTENSHTAERSSSEGKTLFERLLMAPPSGATVIGNSTVGKVHSVEELEAHIRKPQTNKKEEDMAAFKKLFNQSKPSVPADGAVSAAFNQVPSKPVVVQQPQPRVAETATQPFAAFQHANFAVADPAVAAARLQQAQTGMLKGSMFGIYNQPLVQPKPTEIAAPIGAVMPPLLGMFPNTAPPPPVDLIQAPFIEDQMQKAEARMLLNALKGGEFTISELLDTNSKLMHALTPRFREVVPAVLKCWVQQQQPVRQDGGYPGVRRLIVPPPPPPTIQPEPLIAQQLNVPFQPAFKQRIPSPQEIAIHTQGIMHNALVNKKLEEQRENYKRRQEMWRARSPATDESGGSQQLLSTFTPTSVLRQQKRKTETNPPAGEQFLKFTDQPFRANDAQQQQAKNFDMFVNKGRPIIKKSEGSPLFNPIETPYPVHAGQFRSQTPAPPQPQSAAHNFLAGFVAHDQQQSSHFGGGRNLASATACLQGLLLDNQVTSHPGGSRGQSADEGGALSRWLPHKLIEDGLAGKLPDIPMQKMLSVEELERLQTVHN